MDPRPVCRHCGRRWVPPEGVDATVHYCPRCSGSRRALADSTFKADGKVTTFLGGYVLRAKKA